MKLNRIAYIFIIILGVFLTNTAIAEDKGHHDHDAEHIHGEKTDEHGHSVHSDCGLHHEEFDPGATAIHHIADANVFTIGPLSIPLPCIVYVKGEGVKTFMSSKFAPGHHGNGHYSYNGFVLNGGALHRVADSSFPEGKQEVCGYSHKYITVEKEGKDGEITEEKKEVNTVVLKDGSTFITEPKSTLDGGLFGGGITSWYDFSLTKNVVSMILVFIFLAWMFKVIANAYARREGNAPSGIQSVVEPIFTFIQEEVSKPMLGHSWEKYQPFLMSLFFFILGLNLFGQIPFFGNANVTGHISVTIALAVFTALVVNLNGNKHYWEHVFWMPGVPALVKLILTPVEILGVILKPMTLFIRLFGNIAAGHMVIVIFVCLIFIFGNAGQSAAGSAVGIALSIPLTMFMMALEILVAFLQAFVFTILTAVYIGAAIEDHH